MSTTSRYFGADEAQAARELIGGTAIGDLRNELLKQILVATANRTGGSGGSGTVTSVSVTTQNGVSATVTNPTTTPALAFTLGAITPTTVQLSGSVSGTTLLQSPAIAGSAVITFPSVTGTLAITSNTVSQFAAGGTLSSLTGFSLRSTGAAFDLSLATSEVLTANRTLSFNVGNADRTLTIPATGTAALLGTANVFTAAQTINAGTLTTASLTLSQTWNNAGATCRGLEMAVTDTNSAAGSTLFRLLGGAAGTTEFFKVVKDGIFAFTTTNGGGPIGSITSPFGTISFATDGSSSYKINRNIVAEDAALSVSAASGTRAAFLYASATTGNVIDFRNAGSAQTFRIFGTYTDASNYVRLALNTTATSMGIACETAGTGADNIDLTLTPVGTGLVAFSNAASADIAVASTHSARVKFNGTEYKVLLATP